MELSKEDTSSSCRQLRRTTSEEAMAQAVVIVDRLLQETITWTTLALFKYTNFMTVPIVVVLGCFYGDVIASSQDTHVCTQNLRLKLLPYMSTTNPSTSYKLFHKKGRICVMTQGKERVGPMKVLVPPTQHSQTLTDTH